MKDDKRQETEEKVQEMVDNVLEQLDGDGFVPHVEIYVRLISCQNCGKQIFFTNTEGKKIKQLHVDPQKSDFMGLGFLSGLTVEGEKAAERLAEHGILVCGCGSAMKVISDSNQTRK